MESPLQPDPLSGRPAAGAADLRARRAVAAPRLELGPGALARAEAGPGLYVHVPFCAARCGYCDFSSGALSAAAVRRYLDALDREFARRAPAADGTVFRSVFFGGGTPTALADRELARVLASLRGHFALAPGAEITLEANPESSRRARLDAWRGAGFNRVSFGVQSFHDDELRQLGRLHDRARAEAAVGDARAAGFERLSLDLMFGFPGHDEARWEESLDRALALGVPHLSAYAFIVEGGTPLGNAVLRGEAAVLDPDREAELYERLIERAERAGLAGYETSNFCAPGHESRHNLGYWLRRPYLGFGPSAHGLFAGARYANHWSLERWAESLERGLAPESEREPESDESRARETVMLALRLGSGLALTDLSAGDRRHLLARYEAPLEAAVRAGRLERTAAGWRIAPHHRFVADDVIAWIESAAERAVDRIARTPIIPPPCPSLPSPVV